MLEDGRKVTAELVPQVLDEERARLKSGAAGEEAYEARSFAAAARLLDEITARRREFSTFLTLSAYRRLSIELRELALDEPQRAQDLAKTGKTNPRWKGVTRAYKAEDVVRLRGTVHVEHTLARLGAEKLWRYVNEKPFVNALGALTGNQAMQQVKAGLDAIYLSGWQVAGDANLVGPDVSRPVAVPGGLGARRRPAHQQHAQARR